ncbi:hypothetical protein GLOIN_2v1780318 [Rhizophagus clarus]|uniref:Uncharacterized protein n=1 Tax=Rhizophagus clarus TaxID=94130 RepID=A0A8H3LB53_9GLOM|nr:hypothetical protein GLOIN_2v1780318 [Rhizophagus clarus]
MDVLKFCVLFDGQFHIYKKAENLYSDFSFLNVPEVDNFLHSKNRQLNHYKKSVATTFITVLNDMLKCLAENPYNIPLKILDTLQSIFGMDGRKFDLGDKPTILLRPPTQDNIDIEWIDTLTQMLNNLIKYKQYAGRVSTKYWPIALYLLAIVCTFYFLEKIYTQDEYNPLTNDQIDRFETYLKRLHGILEKICRNLEEKQTEDFNGLLRDEFAPFLKEVNDSLEAQLEELKNKKESEKRQTGYAVITFVASTLVAISSMKSDNWKKIASVIFSGISGGVALHKISVVNRLQKVIGEHSNVQETIKESQEFLDMVQKYVDGVRLIDSEILYISYQFKTFHKEVTRLQEKIANLKQ